MKERPILFSAPMVRAILEGRKTQTRRVVNSIAGMGRVTEFQPSDTPGYAWTFRDKRLLWNDMTTPDLLSRCPYGQSGDRLWVREAWHQKGEWRLPEHPEAEWEDAYWDGTKQILYAADAKNPGSGWRAWPSIHMPRWACRIVLEITDVRVGRLQAISETDAQAEGALIGHYYEGATSEPKTYREAFSQLWDSIAAPGARWEDDPWVWVITFRKVRG